MTDIVDTLTDPLLIAGVLGAGACFATIVTLAAPRWPKTNSARA
jgi:hypothetical protein